MFIVLNSLFAAGNKQAEWKRVAESPSGLYSYVINQNNGNYHVSILKDNKLVFCDNQAYRMQDRFFIVWYQEKDVLWVYSGDIGTYYYSISNGEWVKNHRGSSTSSDSEIPPQMIDAVPILKRLLEKQR